MSSQDRLREDRRVAASLRDAGVDVESVFDLVNRDRTPSAAIPVLVELLEAGVCDDWIAEGVVRALTVAEAREAAFEPIRRLFEHSGGESLRWAAGNALRRLATKRHADALLNLACDRSHGKARQEIVAALGKWRAPEVTAVLVSRVEGDDVVLQAVEALGKHRGDEAVSALRQVASHHPREPVRHAASNTLERLLARP